MIDERGSIPNPPQDETGSFLDQAQRPEATRPRGFTFRRFSPDNPPEENFRIDKQTFTTAEALQLCIALTENLVDIHSSNTVLRNLEKQNIFWDKKNNTIGITTVKEQETTGNSSKGFRVDHEGIANLLYFTLTGKDMPDEISAHPNNEDTSNNESVWRDIRPIEKNIISRVYELDGAPPYENSRIGTENVLYDLQSALMKQPLDTDLILSTDMIDNPYINKEILRNAAGLRSDTIQAIRDRTPLIINRQLAYGDNMIHMWVYNFMLRKLCAQEGLDPTNINLKIVPDGEEFMLLENSVRSIIGYDDIVFESNFYSSRLLLVARALNIKLAEGTEEYIPQPVKMEGTVFEKFNKETIIEQGEKIKQGTNNKIITVVQSGSTPEKRFSDEQVIQLVKHIKSISPDSYIQIVSDKAFRDKSKQDISMFSEVADSVTASRDINETCARFYASDHIFTTDSFWGWLSCGTRVMNEDRAGKLKHGDALILYTIAFPKHWAIPGADIIKSPYLSLYDTDTPVRGGMIAGSQYLDTRTRPTRKEYGIYDEDIDLFKAGIKEQLLQS